MPGTNEWDISAAQLRKTHGFAARTDYHRDTEQANAAAELAREILKLSRNTLLIHLRFLESALVRFVPGDENVTPEIATDGQFLYYNSLHICRSFRQAREIVARDYLHLTLHCIFRHLFVGRKINTEIWDLACDIAVEHVISELNIKSLYCERQEKQHWLIRKLKEELPRLTAERIYRWLLEQDLPPQEVSRIRSYFYADDHSIWYKAPEAVGGGNDAERGDDPKDADGNPEPGDTEGTDSLNPENAEEEDGEEQTASGGRATGETRDSGDSGEGMVGDKNDRPGEKKAMSPQETEQMWKDISERIQVDLDTASSSFGENAGDFVAALEEVNREKVDYAAFLRRFAVLGENLQVNDDEFDYIFYTYGLKLYDRMPLIEPLEYKEVQRVREFVIALDTSESVAGELIQTFVTKTWNILKQTENFFTTVNVHILQCGARVEEDAKITNQDEFDAYMRRMVLRGFGGTDFRPVFDHVAALLRQHEFTNLKGLIYFTDGYGTFPPMPPKYEAAFVFVDNGRELPDIPPWAIKIRMTQTDIENLSDR
ncbi:MAG: metallopeptidase [Oscillospiraceae bacterium]|nr:metallopeptidase [Oscillospiraceae bacterium]